MAVNFLYYKINPFCPCFCWWNCLNVFWNAAKTEFLERIITHYALLWRESEALALFWDFRMKDTLIVLLIIFSISNISDSMIMTSTTCVMDFNGIKCNLASATHKALWWAHQGLQRWVSEVCLRKLKICRWEVNTCQSSRYKTKPALSLGQSLCLSIKTQAANSRWGHLRKLFIKEVVDGLWCSEWNASEEKQLKRAF